MYILQIYLSRKTKLISKKKSRQEQRNCHEGELYAQSVKNLKQKDQLL